MAPKAKPKSEEIIQVIEVTQHTLDVCVIGTTELITNRMSEKAKHELLYPKGKKTAIEKATSLKHDPRAEFRASPYTLKDDSEPTYLALPATAFKGGLGTAALDMPGTRKAQVGRLTYVLGKRNLVNLWGIPQLLMSVVRSSDMARTPDIRTRAIVPEWACRLEIQFTRPAITAQAVANLLAAAGMCVGVGDWRIEKGKGAYGSFRIVDQHDETFQRIIRDGGRDAQIAALANPVAYDDESAEMLSWYDDEVDRRRRAGTDRHVRKPNGLGEGPEATV